jgi:hypothetical protein
MSRRRQSDYQTRSHARREFWLRLGVWLFIAVFAFSVVGGLLVVSTQLVR